MKTLEKETISPLIMSQIEATNLPMYYFGKWKISGHYLYNEDGSITPRSVVNKLPIPIRTLDGGLLPDSTRKQGITSITHISGWTILQFFDQSGDLRTGSVSAFIINDILEYKEILAISKQKFPSIWKRIKFELELI